MDLIALGNRILMFPYVKSTRRKDEYYVSTSCGVEVNAPWGGKRIYGACHRAEWYRFKNIEPTVAQTPEGLRKAYWGDYIAMAEMDLYKKLGIWIDAEVRIWYPEYYLAGRVDCFVHDIDSWAGSELKGNGVLKKGSVVGVEHKSTWQYGSKGTIDVKQGEKPWPKWEHIIQCAVYHHYYREFANYWQLVYMARDTGRGRVHNVIVLPDGRISVNGEMLGFTTAHIFNRLGQLGKDLQLEDPPGRDFSLVLDKTELLHRADAGELTIKQAETVRKGNKLVKGDWQCAWCEYPHLCWDGVTLPYDCDVAKVVGKDAA
jgi:hypothetical protein